MHVHIKYFASVRETMGLAHESLQTDCITAGALRRELQARGEPSAQALAEGRAVRMALDRVMCNADALLTDGCELAFFPPVTGG
jgi:molybdopterin synthase sulfur carrier subunit